MRRSIVCSVSDNFFSVLGARPESGRWFNAAESRPNAGIQVAVASYPFWEKMGARADFLGSTVYVNDRPHTIVGIAPKGFSGISAALAPQLYLPMGVFNLTSGAFAETDLTDLENPKLYALNVTARLAPGVTLESVKARIPALAERLTAIQPSDVQGTRDLIVTVPSRFSISTTPESDDSVASIGVLLVAMAGVVLLIASLNLANMLLARGTARAREIAIRLAVGATRWQIIRQLLIEGFVLALLGGAFGVLLSVWSNSLLEQSFEGLLRTFNFALTSDLTPDATAVAATFVACMLATLVFSLGPALKASKADVVNDLKAQAGDEAAHGRWNRFFAGRHILVMTQMTLSLVLLFAAGLFLRGALNASGVMPGFNPNGAIVAEIDYSLINTKGVEAASRQQFVLERVRSLPGVTSAGMSTLIPYGNITNTSRIMPANMPIPESTEPDAPRPGTGGIYTAITRDYLASVGVRLIQGRDFSDVETMQKDAPAVCIVDETMAKALFPEGDALGQRVRYTQLPSDGSTAEMEIVGITSWHRHDIQDDAPARKRIYVPLAKSFSAGVYVMVRLQTEDPNAVLNFLPTLRAAMREADPTMPVLNVSPFVEEMGRTITLWITRLGAFMFGVFGSIALLLAVVGVYGVKAYAVERRTREIGIRIALGAESRDVFALIMRQGAQQIAVSVAVGIVLSLLVGQVLASLLYDVKPWDPIVLGTAAVLLVAATLMACFVPARRAVGVNPITALRSE
jgi:predicted permease